MNNEIEIITHPGDILDDIIDLALRINEVKGISYSVFEFNGVRVFIKKNSTIDSVKEDYRNKLNNT